jgi:hypothetical protein
MRLLSARPYCILILTLTITAQHSFGQVKKQSSVRLQPSDRLWQQFVAPPNEAKPRVWWHWMKGNITKEGIRKDLLWMHQSGIGGLQNFDASIITPQVVSKPLSYMTPEWKDAFGFATHLADSLGLEMAIAGSPGWSESGGPWVAKKDGMKKIVWSERRLKGGQPFSGTLPKPPTITGTFQDIPYQPDLGAPLTGPTPQYYQDIAVLAYRLPAADVWLPELTPKLTSSGGTFTLEKLTDGDLATSSLLPTDTLKGYGWIQYEFAQPQTIKAVTVVGGGIRSPFGILDPSDERRLEVSDDGINFRQIASIPVGRVAQQTISFPAARARYFRVMVKNPPPPVNYGAMLGGSGRPPRPPATTPIAEVVLHPVTRVNRAEEKAGYAAAYDLAQDPTPTTTDGVAETDVIDITSKMNSDGILNWTPPTGQLDGYWKVIRFGFSLTGKQNHPASPEATGLEVDKLDARAVQDYFETYLNQYKDATGGLMGKRGLQYIVTDSYEAGQENWTSALASEFQKRRGYTLLPWMPVLTGVIIKSADESDKFLWDFRKTIAELLTENHYDQLTTILAKYGMKRYSESQENGRVFVGDGMDVKRSAAVPMSAIWAAGGSPVTMAQADIRESASVAHIYGQNLVAAESFTASGRVGGAWSYHPGNLKPRADLALANGLNRFVIHTSVHQPVDDKIPGLSLGPFGQWFTRNETWAAQANVWTDYLARSSYMLQQGKFVADVVYYYGEDNNITGLFGKTLPAIPEGYTYDFINPDALINLLTVKAGKLVTPSGMSYRLLVLDDNAKNMSLPVLRKIVQLVKAGATISGVKPVRDPSRQGNEAEYSRLVAEVWDKQPGTAVAENVYTDQTVQNVLNKLTIKPDFQYTKSPDSTQLLYVHRQLADGELYWVNNRGDKAQRLEATFRVSGKMPQIWHPETGKAEPTSYTIANGMTRIELDLTPNDAVFVVFRTPATMASVSLPVNGQKEVMTLDGPWTVTFQPNRGAPPRATIDKLSSYTENGESGIKYFSGTASYTKTIHVAANLLPKGSKTWLDLGEVKNLAEVIVNGKSVGIVWKSPYRVDVSEVLKPGENNVDIKVTNLWVNRIIGDLQPGVTQKVTFLSFPLFRADANLQPSGLLGPVRVLTTLSTTSSLTEAKRK